MNNDPTREIATVPEQAVVLRSVYGTDDPRAIMQRVVAVAEPLGEFIKNHRMSTKIQGREYVLAEGWAFMGSMLGVFPYTTRVEPLRTDDGVWFGFEAQVELRTRDGAVVGAAIAECTTDERSWSDRDSYALKSMAATRAAGKAFRMSFGFVMKSAGFESTPAEEMPWDDNEAGGAGPRGDYTRKGPRSAITPPQARDEAPVTSDGIANAGQFMTWAKSQWPKITTKMVCEYLDIANVADVTDWPAAVDTLTLIMAQEEAAAAPAAP